MNSAFASIDWRTKSQAFAVHFGISLIIFLVLLYFIIFQWYPSPFFSTDGGVQGLRLIIFVDLVLGPTLTFIVFNRQKPLRVLKLDLTVIAVIQMAALSYGVWATYTERPVAIVFADDTFHPIPYYQFIESESDLKELEGFGNKLPVTIYVDIPDENNLEARVALFRESYQTNTPLFLMGNRYRKLDTASISEIARHSIDMENYLKQDYLGQKKAKMQRRYQEFLAALPRPASEYLYLAFYGRYCKCFLVAERESLKFIDVLEIPPPQVTQKEIHVNK